jgi:predicted metalloprotease
MRLDVDPDLSQVEDRRGMRGGPVAVGGGLGIVGLIAVVLLNLLGGGGGTGFDVNSGFNQFDQTREAGEPLDASTASDADKRIAQIVTHVQRTWEEKFREAGRDYPETKIVFFEGGVSTGCGSASSAVGPFYCPADRRVYLDQGFFTDLSARFGAPGDFAQAYVIAHEFGHHIQTVTGIEPQVREAQQRDPDSANELSVRMELQADCLAGVWGHTAYQRGELEPGDVEEGLGAAAAVGDDRIQREATGRVDPHSFTHGTSEQRQSWFTKGLETGEMTACDTFSGDI